MIVKEWMSKTPWTITEDRSIKEAKEMMMEHKVRRLPVVTGDILIGIITKDDILAASPSIVDFQTTEEIKKQMEETHVASVMTEDPYTVNAQDPIERAAAIMAEKKVGALPVLEGGKLVGVISETDIFRGFVKILGLTEESDRQEFEVERPEDAIDRIVDQLQAEGRRVLSLFSYDARSAGKTKVVVRLVKK
jgi:acetoin utilization protein AcuB